MKRQIAVIASAIAIAIATGLILDLYFRPEKKTDTAIAPMAYADAKSCIPCHASEAADYATTGMARGFYRPDEKTTVHAPAKDRQFFHSVSNTFFSMTEHDGKYFQRRWQQ